MKKLKQRLLSMILAVLMVVGMLPVQQMAIVEAATPTTLYLNAGVWDTADAWFAAYFYNGSANTWETGTKTTDGMNYYKFVVPAGYTNVIFCRMSNEATSTGNWDNVWNQTDDLPIPTDGKNLYQITGWGANDSSNSTGAWAEDSYSGDESGGNTETPAEGTKRIYFDTRNYLPSGWGQAYLYMWNSGQDNSGTTVKMDSVTDEYDKIIAGFFYYDVDLSKYTNVIFKPNKNNWDGQTNEQVIPSDKNLFTCTDFNKITSGTWGTYGNSVSGNNFPSNVTGKATFFDLYTDKKIMGLDGAVAGYGFTEWKLNGKKIAEDHSMTAIGRGFSLNVNKAIASYWNDYNEVYPLYFGNFQPYYFMENDETITAGTSLGSQDPWWWNNNNFKDESNNYNRDAYMNMNNYGYYNFSWFLNRSIDGGNYGAVVQGLVGDELVEGNIVAKNTKKELPQFNESFYTNGYEGNAIGEVYKTTDFPFVIREIEGAKYYTFDSGVSGSSYHDTVRMNTDGTLTYYSDEANVVYGITADGDKTPGFFPFNDPDDTVTTSYKNADGETKYSYSSLENQLNYGFGMKLEINFTIDNDGKIEVKDANGNTTKEVPAIFEFSGDDDVWVYVDDQLALDMGGDHGVATGRIDFSTVTNNSTDTARPQTVTSTVDYVKTVADTDKNAIEGDVATTANDAIKVENVYDKADYINYNATASVNVTDTFNINMTDETKIHTLTIFYEERGMFESNFKVTFNLEQPTVLKTTNTVNVDGVNAGLQEATKTATADDTFYFDMNDANGAEVNGKKYTTESGSDSLDENEDLQLKDGGSATFIKQFERAEELELIQVKNDSSRYDTSWTMSEISESGINSAIAASYVKDDNGNKIRDSLKVSDSRATDLNEATTAFILENKDNGADQAKPAKVQIDYVQTPKTGGIAIQKQMEEGTTSDNIFSFTVYLSNIFGKTSTESTYNLKYDIYAFDGANSTIVRKNVEAANGVVSLKAGQFALINGIPVGTKYRVVENNSVGYSATGLDVATNKHNDNASGNVNTATVTGEVAEDTDSNVDMFVYTNGAENLTDSFLIEEGKENTLNVIPDENVDGQLAGNVEKINDYWKDSTAEKKGFVFIVDGAPSVDDYNKPNTTLVVDGVTYSVDLTTGKPVIKVTGEPTGDTTKITIRYQLVELNDDGTVRYKEVEDPTTGGNIQVLAGISSVITATNYFYDANDDVYVLDYGLDVELSQKTTNEDGSSAANSNGLFENDSLANPELSSTTSTYWNTETGKNESTATLTEVAKNTEDKTGTYGTIKITNADTKITDTTNPTVTYSMSKFLEGEDDFNYGVMIQKNGAAATQTSNRFRLHVTSNIKIVPASVVYYEDNFDAIVVTENAQTDTADTCGIHENASQSNVKDTLHGNDNAYANDEGDSDGGSIILSTDAKYDEDGNLVKGSSDTVSFTFKGTGFDIVGRSTSTSGVLTVLYSYIDSNDSDGDGNATEKINKILVVDTYYANGDLYQIPVVSVRNLPYGECTVKISLAASSRGCTFYLDGIRIYNPAQGNSDVTDNYQSSEQGTTFYNVHDMLVGDGEITETVIRVDGDGGRYTDYVVDVEGEGRTAALVNVPSDGNIPELYGYSNMEEITGTASVYTAKLSDYLAKGPNNEVYLGAQNAIAFYVTANSENTANRTLQVEAKQVNASSSTTSSSTAPMISTVKKGSDGKFETVKLATINTGTAMYYNIPIDEDHCIKMGDGKYLVIVVGSETSSEIISISNIKSVGYTISQPEIDNTNIKLNANAMSNTAYQIKVDNISVSNAYANSYATVTITVSNYDPNKADNVDLDLYLDAASNKRKKVSELTPAKAELETKTVNEKTITFVYSIKMSTSSQKLKLTVIPKYVVTTEAGNTVETQSIYSGEKTISVKKSQSSNKNSKKASCIL